MKLPGGLKSREIWKRSRRCKGKEVLSDKEEEIIIRGREGLALGEGDIEAEGVGGSIVRGESVCVCVCVWGGKGGGVRESARKEWEQEKKKTRVASPHQPQSKEEYEFFSKYL